MKKSYFILLLISMMSFGVVKADVYSDGLTTYLRSGLNGQFNLDELMKQFVAAGIDSTKYSADQLVTDMADIMASYYRANMSEVEFQQMIAFYTQPEIVKVTQKYYQNYKQLSETFSKEITNAAMQFAQGNTPTNIEVIPCSEAYQAAFDKYWVSSDMDVILQQTLDALKQIFLQTPNSDTEQQQKRVALFEQMCTFMKQNMYIVLQNYMTQQMTLEELQLFTSGAEQPFYPSYKQTMRDLTADFQSIVMKLLEKIQ